ncbi:MAG: hypothetical protein M3R37_00390 [Actinomycetota bacterium]|nr:hypothetical protein [Actinomycetota bacterium]
MSEHDHEGGKPPAPADEEAGDKGLGTETGVNEAGDDVLESMPETRGEVVYPDVENPEGPPRTPKEGEVDEDADKETDASRGADDDA